MKKVSLGNLLGAGKKKPKKQYGLILPKKQMEAGAAPSAMAKPLELFKRAAEEADADRGKKGVNRNLAAAASSLRVKKQMKQAHDEALAQDASVFDYDGVYDSIQEARQQAIENHSLCTSKERKRKVCTLGASFQFCFQWNSSHVSVHNVLFALTGIQIHCKHAREDKDTRARAGPHL